MTIQSEDLISYWQREIKDSQDIFGKYHSDLADLKKFLKAAIEERLVFKGEKVVIIWDSDGEIEFREGCKRII